MEKTYFIPQQHYGYQQNEYKKIHTQCSFGFVVRFAELLLSNLLPPCLVGGDGGSRMLALVCSKTFGAGENTVSDQRFSVVMVLFFLELLFLFPFYRNEEDGQMDGFSALGCVHDLSS